MICKKCNERMDGDGYRDVVRCPNADDETYRYHAPDEGPVYCDFKEDELTDEQVAKGESK